MASEPIPEPLTNQKVKTGEESTFPSSTRSGPELVRQAAPPIPAERELPAAPRQQEWKDAVQEALESATQAVQAAKEQARTAVSQAKDRAADFYRDSREKTAEAAARVRSRAGHIVNEYPLHVIAGVAAVAFMVGVMLRVWRSSRDA